MTNKIDWRIGKGVSNKSCASFLFVKAICEAVLQDGAFGIRDANGVLLVRCYRHDGSTFMVVAGAEDWVSA